MNVPDARHALVIGAGLAGAAVTAALARRGWRVELFDAAAGPANAASSLPVGMLSPHITKAPTPLSRLSVLGVARTRAELARRVPQGAGWQDTGVDNHGHDAGPREAALVRPSALVQAWLEEARALGRLQTHWSTPLGAIQRHGARWALLDPGGHPIASAPDVVVAAALGSLGLLVPHLLNPSALPLRPVQGQLSLGPWNGPPLAPRPQRHQGVFVPLYEDHDMPLPWPTRLWSMGATYERGATHLEVSDNAHRVNLNHLRQQVPAAADALLPALERQQWLGWTGIRCATLDRLPLVGTLPDLPAWTASRAAQRLRPPMSLMPRLAGLHVLTGLGSRGLSLAAWCADALAARMSGESDPAPPDLLDAIDPARFVWRQSRRSPA